jgi:hypothetical protein
MVSLLLLEITLYIDSDKSYLEISAGGGSVKDITNQMLGKLLEQIVCTSSHSRQYCSY